MFGHYFEQYDEFDIYSTLSAADLTERLCNECSTMKVFFSIDGIKAQWNSKTINLFHLRKTKPELVLFPVGHGRNSLRGQLHCSIMDDAEHGGSLTHVVLKPMDYSISIWLIHIFSLLFAALAIYFGKYIFALHPLAMIVMCNLVLLLCRHMAEGETMMIKHSFETFVRQLEG